VRYILIHLPLYISFYWAVSSIECFLPNFCMLFSFFTCALPAQGIQESTIVFIPWRKCLNWAHYGNILSVFSHAISLGLFNEFHWNLTRHEGKQFLNMCGV
jgi:hypothetical protein